LSRNSLNALNIKYPAKNASRGGKIFGKFSSFSEKRELNRLALTGFQENENVFFILVTDTFKEQKHFSKVKKTIFQEKSRIDTKSIRHSLKEIMKEIMKTKPVR